MITRFRKRPVEVEAVRWTGDNLAEVQAFVGQLDHDERLPGFVLSGTGLQACALVFDKLHDTWVRVMTGQWVVKGVKGEFYPIDEPVLAETYDKADDAAPETVTIRGEVYEVNEWDLRDPGCAPGETWTWTLYATPVEAAR